MRRFINIVLPVESVDQDMIFEKRTDSEQPEYSFQVRDVDDENLITIHLTESEFNDLVKGLNQLKREE
jgi:hypothetical protein